jgi:hypothetical protein
MANAPHYSLDDAVATGTAVGVDWATCGFTPEAFQAGMHVEHERAVRDGSSGPGGPDPLVTAEKAATNLFEFPDYYTEKDMLEAAYDEYWSERTD